MKSTQVGVAIITQDERKRREERAAARNHEKQKSVAAVEKQELATDPEIRTPASPDTAAGHAGSTRL